MPNFRTLAATSLAATLLLAACKLHDPDKNAKTEGELNAARERGRIFAERADAKLLSDCNALADEDERYGCADWINHRDD
jgi:hypothetical protein